MTDCGALETEAARNSKRDFHEIFFRSWLSANWMRHSVVIDLDYSHEIVNFANEVTRAWRVGRLVQNRERQLPDRLLSSGKTLIRKWSVVPVTTAPGSVPSLVQGSHCPL